MQLPKMLQDLMARNEMTVSSLAQRTSVPMNTIHNWLAGMPPRNVLQVKQIADYFDVTVDYLVFGTPLIMDPSKAVEVMLDGHFEVVLRPVRKENGQ